MRASREAQNGRAASIACRPSGNADLPPNRLGVSSRWDDNAIDGWPDRAVGGAVPCTRTRWHGCWGKDTGLRYSKTYIRKTFLFDAQAGQAGAFYLSKGRASAEAAHDEAWCQRIRSTCGSDPQIRYFETPLVVDNALGELITE